MGTNDRYNEVVKAYNEARNARSVAKKIVLREAYRLGRGESMVDVLVAAVAEADRCDATYKLAMQQWSHAQRIRQMQF